MDLDAVFHGLSAFNFYPRLEGKEIEFAQSIGLIPGRDHGPVCCGRRMNSETSEEYQCGFRFRCVVKDKKKKKICRKTVNPLTNTWFGPRTQLSFKTMLQLTYCFISSYKVSDAALETGVSIVTAI